MRTDSKTIEELKKASQTPVTTEQGQLVASKIGAFKFLECSARTNQGVKEVFEVATRAALTVRKSVKNKSKCVIV